LSATNVVAVSSIYQTAPWGLEAQPSFLNCVAALDTELDPFDLMTKLLNVESRLGRVRLIRWGPRLIDLDLLLYDTLEINTELLVLPHPLMTVRRFVLAPLMELDSGIIVKGLCLADHLTALVKEPNQEVMLWSPPPTRIGKTFK
jgi:2-amino-4-hydroxy-6-hydroxymethyldihydropteridine diphosphokinase